jgi:hypothetical protein
MPARPTGDDSIIRRLPSPGGPASSSLASGVITIPGPIYYYYPNRASAMMRGA